MPVKLRLQRHGRKQRPFYHIVAADSRAPRDGRFIEKVGTYNPVSNPSSVNLSVDRALYWLQNGAVPSDKVRSILSQEGVLYKNHLQGGVKKGALTQDQADAKFETWMKDKEKKTGHLLDSMRKASDADKASRLAAEKAVSDKRASDLAAAEAAANAPVEEPASEETSEEVASVDEEPVAEASTEETPGE